MTTKDDLFDTSNHLKNKQKVSKTYGSIRSRLRPKPSRPIDQISQNSKLEQDDENFKEIKRSSLSDSKAGPSKPTAVSTKPFLRSRVNQEPRKLLLDRSNAQEPTRKRELINPTKEIENPKPIKQPRKKKITVLEDQESRLDSSFFLDHSIDPLLNQSTYPMQQGMDQDITLRLDEHEHEKVLGSIPGIPTRRRLRSNDHQLDKRTRLATGSGSLETKNQTEGKKRKPAEKKEDLMGKSVKGSLRNKKEKQKIVKDSPVMVSGEKFVPLDDDEYSDDPLRI